MRIKVKLNSTGETGTVEDTEFNPQIYTKVENSTLPNIDLGESPTTMSTRLAEESKARKEKVNEFLAPIGQIGGGIIGGIVAGPVGAVTGAALGGGLGEAASQTEKDKFSIGEVAKEAAWGAGGELLGLGAAKLIGKIGEGAKAAKTASKVAKGSQVEDWGDDLVKSVIKPKIKPSPTMASDIDEIMTIANKHGLTGMSAADAATKMDDVYTTAMKKVNKAAKGFTPDNRVIKMAIDEALPEVSDLSKSTTKIISNKLNTRIASANGDDLLKLKYELQKDIQKIYNPAHVATEEEAVKAVYHNAIDEYLKLNVPGTKEGLEIMSDLHKVAPGIATSMKTAEKGVKLPIIGTQGGEIAGKAKQEIISKTGKFLQNVGRGTVATGGKITGAISKVATAIPNQVIAPAVQTGIQLNRQQTGLPTTTETGLPDITAETTTPTTTEIKGSYITGYSPEQLYQGYMAAMNAGDSKAATKLKSMYTDETAYQKTQGKTAKTMTAGQKKEITDFQISEKLMENLIPDIEAAADKGIIGPISGRARTINPYDANVQIFNSSMKAAAQTVGRAIEGGVLRAEDIPKYQAMLPNITDTKATALGKIKNVMRMLELQRKTKEDYYTSSENLGDITLPSATETGLSDIEQ